MGGRLGIKTLFKRRFRRFVSFVCLVCFTIVTLISATLVVALAEHEYDNFAGCPRTLNPLCLCENGDSSPFSLAQARYSAQTSSQPQPNDETKSDCLECALIRKAVSPLRQSRITVSSLPISDDCSFAFAVLCSQTLSGFITPIDLKTKMSN